MKSSGSFQISGNIKANPLRKGLILSFIPFLVFAFAVSLFCACPPAHAFSNQPSFQADPHCCCDHETAHCKKNTLRSADPMELSGVQTKEVFSSFIGFFNIPSLSAFIPEVQPQYFSPQRPVGFSDLFLKNEILRI